MHERTKISGKETEAKRKNSASKTLKPDFSQLTGLPVDQILFFQRTIGNQAVQRLIKGTGFRGQGIGLGIQAKLRIGQPNDVYEQEADRVAEQVMRMDVDSFGGGRGEAFVKSSLPIQNKIQRQPEEPEPEEQNKFDLRLDWFEMSRPFYTRGAASMLHFDDNMYLSIGNVWTHNYHFFSNFGLGDELSADAANFFTPFTIDSALKRDFPTASELFERNANISSFVVNPTLFNFDIHDIPGTLRFPFLKIFGVEQSNPYAPVQRKCAKCNEKEDLKVQRKAESEGSGFSVPSDFVSSLGVGQPLDRATRNYFEPRFGADFSHVRVHTGQLAAETAIFINASAYTVGTDAVFGAGQYAPETLEGRRLLAHELAHVVQQCNAYPRIYSSQIRTIQRKEAVAEAKNSPGEMYSKQFRQLDVLIGERLRARAITEWAMNFFQSNPDITEIAKALTKKIDDAFLAVNKITETFMAGFIFDLNNWFPGLTFREPIDYAADLYLKRSLTPWLFTSRIPRPVAVALVAVEDMRGKCEEHGFLAVYLLTIGHMIQNMPFGQLKTDIFYTGIAEKSHAKAILVKGAEFKNALIASKKETGKIDAKWLCMHPDLWGENAWVADGWKGEAKKLSEDPKPLDYIMSQAFRRDVTEELPSEWDITVDEMARRVGSVYSI